QPTFWSATPVATRCASSPSCPRAMPAAPFSSTSAYPPRRPSPARPPTRTGTRRRLRLTAIAISSDRSAASDGQPRPGPDSEARFGNAAILQAPALRHPTARRLDRFPVTLPKTHFVLLMRSIDLILVGYNPSRDNADCYKHAVKLNYEPATT